MEDQARRPEHTDATAIPGGTSIAGRPTLEVDDTAITRIHRGTPSPVSPPAGPETPVTGIEGHGPTMATEAKPEAVAESEQGRRADMHDEDAHTPGQAHCVRVMPIDKITVDEGIQPRVKLVPSVIQEYAEAMAEGHEFPPLTAFFDGNTNWLADGFHRIAAAEFLGCETIRVQVIAGTRRDAILYAVAANAAHGLQRSNADKRRAVEMLLKDDEWGRWANREIARRAGVSHTFVSGFREEPSGNGCQIGNERIVQRGDTTYTMKTDGIGGSGESGKEDPSSAADSGTGDPGAIERAGDGEEPASIEQIPTADQFIPTSPAVAAVPPPNEERNAGAEPAGKASLTAVQGDLSIPGLFSFVLDTLGEYIGGPEYAESLCKALAKKHPAAAKRIFPELPSRYQELTARAQQGKNAPGGLRRELAKDRVAGHAGHARP